MGKKNVGRTLHLNFLGLDFNTVIYHLIFFFLRLCLFIDLIYFLYKLNVYYLLFHHFVSSVNEAFGPNPGKNYNVFKTTSTTQTHHEGNFTCLHFVPLPTSIFYLLLSFLSFFISNLSNPSDLSVHQPVGDGGFRCATLI